jgi:hypothetical protein
VGRTTAGRRPGRGRTARALPSPRTRLRRLTRLAARREAERLRHERRLAAFRRAADRRLATVVQELAALRHHEARAQTLTRLLAERDLELAAQRERIARLEALLQKPTQLG